MKLEDILIEHGERKKIGKLELNSKGVCHLSINHELVVSIEKSLDGKGFYLYAVVDILSPTNLNEVAVTALIGNLFCRETGKGNLGYDPRTHSLVLFVYFEEEQTDYFTYYHGLENFISYLHYWIEKIEAIKTQPESEVQSSPAKGMEKNLKIFFG